MRLAQPCRRVYDRRARPTLIFTARPCRAAVVRELGRGGMGVVYLARQEKLNRYVALKMVLTGCHASERDKARFLTEAEAVAKLHHPHIVQIFEIGESEGRPYFSLEYVSGGSLAGKLDGTPLPASDAASFTMALARAVQSAHDCGVVHRDLKPANVLLAETGSSHASETDGDAGPRYAAFSPRLPAWALQAVRALGYADRRLLSTQASWPRNRLMGTDRTARRHLRAVRFYELITSRPHSAKRHGHHLAGRQPGHSTRNFIKCPGDLETICLKCLQKNRISATLRRCVADDLQRFPAGEASGRPVGADRPAAAKPVHASPACWRLALVLVVVSSLFHPGACVHRARRQYRKKTQTVGRRGPPTCSWPSKPSIAC